MKHPLTMSIIIVQPEHDRAPRAYVSYEDGDEERNRVSLELKLDLVDDATDMQMWAQMVTARVCDAL